MDGWNWEEDGIYTRKKKEKETERKKKRERGGRERERKAEIEMDSYKYKEEDVILELVISFCRYLSVYVYYYIMCYAVLRVWSVWSACLGRSS